MSTRRFSGKKPRTLIIPLKQFAGGDRRSETEDDDIIVTPKGAFRKDSQVWEDLKGSKIQAEIFKMQRPLVTNDPEPKILVYNERRTWQGEIPDDIQYNELFQGKAKVYVIAGPDVNGALIIHCAISDQNW